MNASQFIHGTRLGLLSIYEVQREKLGKLPTAQLMDLQHDFGDAKKQGKWTERTAAEILEGACEIILCQRGEK